MTDHNLVHFACRGTLNNDNPSNSCLFFQLITADDSVLTQDLITIEKLSRLYPKLARLVFFSACQTVENKVVQLQEEVLHLASGFQVAGFAHAIATMWSTFDDVCARIAEFFYGQLDRKEWKKMKDKDTARALHEAILRVRNQGPNRMIPLRWAQYVHFDV